MGERAEYAPGIPPGGGLIDWVEPGSPADRAGIQTGMRVVSVDDAAIADIIDWQWHSEGSSVSLGVVSGIEQFETVVHREAGEAWGISFDSALFDRVRTCRNDCAFCFMKQLPEGLRRALYLRDDDFRLSFLQGNFVTLTNLSDADVERIIEQHLSPLYVSLHAVTPEIRDHLVSARCGDSALARFDQLLEGGVDMHVQIVLVPGVNDAAELDTTLTWLAERDGVLSVGVVPVGYTSHQEAITESYGDPLASAKVIEQVQRWQFAMRDRDGVTWVHLADEFYLNARAPFPRTEWYDGYPQYENGIGLVRSFVDDTLALRTEIEYALLDLPAREERVTIVTGVMAATTIAGALDACEAVGRVRLLVVPNRFFGGNVSVTGLLTGRDIVDAISSECHPGVYVIPDVVFNADGITIDGMTLGQISSGCDSEVITTGSDARGLLDALQRIGSDML